MSETEKHSYHERVWLEWLAEVMGSRPQRNFYLDSERGLEVGKLCFDFERDNFNWRRSDTDTFWIDVAMFVKYKLSDDEIRFALAQQPGIDNYSKHTEERKAYAEFMRGLEKLRAIEAGVSYSEWKAQQDKHTLEKV